MHLQQSHSGTPLTNPLYAASFAQLPPRSGLDATDTVGAEFLCHVSHEMRTPLNTVLGFTHLLQADPLLSTRNRQQIESIAIAGDHLRGLIEDLSDVARVGAGRLRVESVPVSMSVVLDDVLKLFEIEARRCGVGVRSQFIGPATPIVLGDALRLRQVLLNLLSNAVKYNHAGGFVDIALACDACHVKVTVQDTGIGMTRGQLSHLFEPFNRLGREASVVPGTGIGLVLVRQLVQLMGGSIDVQSRAGSGTCVTLTLACAEPANQSDEAVAQREGGAWPALAQCTEPHGTVLYIEDDPVNALIVQDLVGACGDVGFVHAATGAQGIELALKHRPDLVLLDMGLPDMGGQQVLQALSGDHAGPALKVVVLSGGAMPDEVQEILEMGALEYWSKPLNFRHFLQDMERHLPCRPIHSIRPDQVRS